MYGDRLSLSCCLILSAGHVSAGSYLKALFDSIPHPYILRCLVFPDFNPESPEPAKPVNLIPTVDRFETRHDSFPPMEEFWC